MTQTSRTAIIADDLTGACDTGVQFASPESPSAVLVAGDGGLADELTSILQSDGRVIVDTESRHLPASKAYERVRGVTDCLRDASVDLVYKKIDSTLRGNIPAELGALHDAFPDRIVVFAPAYPAAGRTTVDGCCLVDGTPVDETEFGRDRRSPVTSAKLSDYLREGVRVITTRPDALPGALHEAQPGSVVIIDASTDVELDAIAACIAADPRRYIPVGSAGLAGAIRRARANGAGDAHASPVALPAAVLGLVGSVSERSRIQAARLRESVEVRSVVLDPSRASSQAKQVTAALSAGRDVLLITPMPPESGGESRRHEAQAVARALGQIAREAVDTVPRLGLFMTGGDTALGVLEALDTRTLLVYRELAAGIPVVAIEYRSGAARVRVPAITKAGGFGSNEIMVEAFDCLRGGTCVQ